MSIDSVIDLISRALQLATLVAAPVLGVGLVVGLAVAIFQAATQIQESALAFVPKLAAMAAVIVVGGHWSLELLVRFTTSTIASIADLGGGP